MESNIRAVHVAQQYAYRACAVFIRILAHDRVVTRHFQTCIAQIRTRRVLHLNHLEMIAHKSKAFYRLRHTTIRALVHAAALYARARLNSLCKRRADFVVANVYQHVRNLRRIALIYARTARHASALGHNAAHHRGYFPAIYADRNFISVFDIQRALLIRFVAAQFEI